jgi:glycosyltransferase involved in cell wall biosynthesis
MTGPGRPLRVCFFNRSYWPDTGATGQLLTELCEDLSQVHGLQVTVVTGFPATAPEEGIAGGPARRLRAREHRNGVEIRRTWGTTWSPRRFFGRTINYLTYFVSATSMGLRLPRQDVTVALTDPPIIGLSALAARPRHGFVFFCQDIFPEVARLLTDFQSPLVDRFLDRVNRRLVKRAERTLAIGETMARRLIEGKGADPARVEVIHNWADTAAIVPSDKSNPFSQAHGLADRFVVLHAGNIGHGQNLDVVIDAAEMVANRPDIVMLFIGDGTRRLLLQEAVRARRLPNVRFLPFQPRAEMRWTYASSDVCLVSLSPGLAGYIVPSKLYPILAAGRPYIAAVDSASEVATITEQHRCGVVVPPGDAAGMAHRLLELADDADARARMGARAREAAMTFDRARQVAAHAAVIRAIAADRR